MTITRLAVVLSICAIAAACHSDDDGGLPLTPPAPTPTATPTLPPEPTPTPPSGTDAEAIEELEQSGAIPDLDRSAELAGADSDDDGVRDDVEVYIEAQYEPGPPQAAARQFARTLQQAVEVDPENASAVKALSVESARAVKCIFARFPSDGTGPAPSQVVSELEAITTNTRERLQAYLAFNRALDGTSISRPTGDTCE